jgi:hypothetical protein
MPSSLEAAVQETEKATILAAPPSSYASAPALSATSSIVTRFSNHRSSSDKNSDPDVVNDFHLVHFFHSSCAQISMPEVMDGCDRFSARCDGNPLQIMVSGYRSGRVTGPYTSVAQELGTIWPRWIKAEMVPLPIAA